MSLLSGLYGDTLYVVILYVDTFYVDILDVNQSNLVHIYLLGNVEELL
jgi:hypothetical protein